MKLLTTTASLALLAAPALAAPVDLTSWSSEGAGVWQLQAGNNAVLQTRNDPPTIFHNNSSASQGMSLSGTIEVKGTFDDDWIGFVLGYDAGEISSSSADYWLVDWKQGDQGGFTQGLALSHVTGALPQNELTSNPAWSHTGIVDLKTRSNAPGSLFATQGWADLTEYTFDLEFTANNIKVFVNGGLEIDYDAAPGTSFTDGGFGFYNFSQSNVLYAGIQEDVVAPVPLPAGLPLLLAGLGGMALLRRKKAA